jgi:hypothetical protein
MALPFLALEMAGLDRELFNDISTIITLTGTLINH